MPDHFHLFVATDDEKITPSKWMKSLKWTRCIWQKTFFDHLLGGTEYYSENWKYIRENPVRAGLVQKSGAVAIYGRRLDWNITRVMRHRRS